MVSTRTIPDILSSDWRRWIVENKLQKLSDDKIISILVSNGVDEAVARQEVDSILVSDPCFQAGSSNTQRLKKLESVLNTLHAVNFLDPSSSTVTRKCMMPRVEFLQHHYAANRPVVFTDFMEGWQAVQRWTPDYLKSKCGHVAVEVMTNRNSDPEYELNMQQHKTQMSFGEFIDKAFSGLGTNDYYLTGNNFFLDNPEVSCLLEDISVPSEYLNATIPGYSFFWFGPSGTITKAHHDEINILMSQVRGRKHIRLVAPTQSHLLYNSRGVYSDVDWGNPDHERFPLFKEVQFLDVTLSPGEALFIPVGWWHYVRAIEPSITISFCNFVFPNDYTYLDPEIVE